MAFSMLLLPATSAFLMAGRPAGLPRASYVSMAASDLLSVTSTNGLAITDALRDYAGSKLAKPLERHESILAGVSLHLKVEHRGGGLHDEAHAGLDAHVAEITATTKDKRIVRVTAETEDMCARPRPDPNRHRPSRRTQVLARSRPPDTPAPLSGWPLPPPPPPPPPPQGTRTRTRPGGPVCVATPPPRPATAGSRPPPRRRTPVHTRSLLPAPCGRYASIDNLSATLTRKLRKFKERRSDAKVERGQAGKASLEAILDEDEDDDEMTPSPAPFVAPPAPAPTTDWSVVRKKEFAMPPMSVGEAVEALEYIDHDFYVFRDSATSEINVVYRRNSGGVGLIQPEA